MRKGFTLIELLIVVAIIAILAAIAVPNFLEAQVRSKVARVKADQRSLATGIEAYFVDNNQYPAHAIDGGDSVFAAGHENAGVHSNIAGAGNYNKYVRLAQGITGTQLDYIYTFAVRGTTSMGMLTTPVAYITSYFPDPFMDTKGATFGYFANNSGWIIWSAGPDTDQMTGTELGFNTTTAGAGNSVETLYDIRINQPSLTLVTGTVGTAANAKALTYDPSNGTVSSGDVWRVKQ